MDEPANVDEVSDLFKALSSSVRLTVLIHLMGGGHTVHELVEHLRVSQPLVSQHLRVLRAAGLVKATPTGRERVYEITDEHVSSIVKDALQHVDETRTPVTRTPATPTPATPTPATPTPATPTPATRQGSPRHA